MDGFKNKTERTKSFFIESVKALFCSFFTKVLLLILTVWLISSYIAKEITLDFVCRNYCGAVGFDYYLKDFNQFINSQSLKDGEVLNSDQIPNNIKLFGIRKIYRKGRYIFFLEKFSGIMADSAESGFFYDLEKGHPSITIREVVANQKKDIFHIQQLSFADGWYYWLYD